MSSHLFRSAPIARDMPLILVPTLCVLLLVSGCSDDTGAPAPHDMARSPLDLGAEIGVADQGGDAAQDLAALVWRIAPEVVAPLEVGQVRALGVELQVEEGRWQVWAEGAVNWSTSDTALLAIESGRITALAPGEARLRARYKGEEQEVSVTLVTPPLMALRLEPDSVVMESNAVLQLQIVSEPQLDPRELNWEVLDAPNSLSVDAQGQLFALAPGEGRVRACHEQVCAETEVKVRTLDRFQITPGSGLVRVGDEVPLTLTALSETGEEIEVLRAPAELWVETEELAQLDPAGVMSVLAPGEIKLRGGRIGEPRTQGLASFEARLKFTELDCSSQNCCGRDALGDTYCFGSNRHRWLGKDDFGSDSTTPVKVAGEHDFREIFMGPGQTCALTQQGEAMCWGSNALGQVGDGTFAHRAQPVHVAGNHRFTTIAIGQGSTCGLDEQGALYCWGVYTPGLYHFEMPPIATDIVQLYNQPRLIASGPYTQLEMDCGMACVADASDQWWCMGRNSYGELGNGERIDDEYATDMLSKLAQPVPFPKLAAGCFGGCALDAQGAVWCWGENRSENLGLPNPSAQEILINLSPVRTEWSRTLSSIETGAGDTFCGRDAVSQEWVCWGNNLHCQLGVNAGSSIRRSYEPIAAPSTDEVAGLLKYEVGAWFVCGLHQEGDVYCWGSDWSSGIPPIYTPNCRVKPYRIRQPAE